jgi:dTDP-4-amino-4,6-dideoxygalactose transaminase
MEKINVTRSSMPSFEEYCEMIRPLWDSRWLTNMGALHRQLEDGLRGYLGVPGVTLYTNGHLALEGILEAMDFERGDEIITTPFTFASTTHAIVRAGYTPVFCDVKADDYTIDPEKIEPLITERTRAILAVHVYGNLCDVDAIDRIARRHGLKVIYDAAHAFGVRYRGRSASSFGDASMFSFHATKVFHTIEGGAACYGDLSLAERLSVNKNFGQNGQDDCIYAGGNAKMSEFQAAMGLCNLRHLGGEIAKRRAAVLRYRERLAGVDGLRLSPEQEGVESNYAYFPVLFEGYAVDRDEMFLRLSGEGVIARKYFSPLTSDFSCYRALDPGKTPIAASLASSVLTLPLYADLSVGDVDRICDIILR